MKLWTVVLIVRTQAAEVVPLEGVLAENLAHLQPSVVVEPDRYEIRLTVRTATLAEAQRYAADRVAGILAHVGLFDAAVELRGNTDGHA
jgi:hypothetical protein